jgi:hypothetical protein
VTARLRDCATARPHDLANPVIPREVAESTPAMRHPGRRGSCDCAQDDGVTARLRELANLVIPREVAESTPDMRHPGRRGSCDCAQDDRLLVLSVPVTGFSARSGC